VSQVLLQMWGAVELLKEKILNMFYKDEASVLFLSSETVMHR